MIGRGKGSTVTILKNKNGRHVGLGRYFEMYEILFRANNELKESQT